MELSPHSERKGTLLIKVTRLIQLLQTSKDFLSQKKGREEGHVLRPPPLSQEHHLLHVKQVRQLVHQGPGDCNTAPEGADRGRRRSPNASTSLSATPQERAGEEGPGRWRVGEEGVG